MFGVKKNVRHKFSGKVKMLGVKFVLGCRNGRECVRGPPLRIRYFLIKLMKNEVSNLAWISLGLRFRENER